MPQRKAIRQLQAGFLLALLMLGNSPRQWLHDYFATHQGCAVISKRPEGKDCLQKDRPHCRLLDQVVVAPFMEPSPCLLEVPAACHAAAMAVHYAGIRSGYSCRSGLRGPPSVDVNG